MVDAGDDLVELEFNATAKVLLREIVDVAVIVDVVDLDLKSLTLLKVILDGHFGDPLWRQVIVNDFSLSQLGPHVALLLVHDQERVRERHSVHVGEIFAPEGEAEFLARSRAVEVGGSEHGLVDV